MKKQGVFLIAVLVSFSLLSNVSNHNVELGVYGDNTTTAQSFEVTVYNNAKPQFSSVAPTVVLEDSVYTYNVTTVDDDGDALMVSAKTLPSWLTLSFDYDGTALLTGVPDNSKVGTHSVELEVTDAFATSTQSFEITVYNNNDKPEFSSVAPIVVLEDSVYTYNVTAVDDDGDALMVSAKTLPSWLSLSFNYDGTATLTGVPNNSEVGEHTIELELTDAFTTSTQSFVVKVYNTNDVPVFTCAKQTSVEENSVYTYSITTKDDDDDALMISAKSLPEWLILTDNDDGTAILSALAENSEEGTHSIELEVTDAFTSSTQSYILTVNEASVNLYLQVQ